MVTAILIGEATSTVLDFIPNPTNAITSLVITTANTQPVVVSIYDIVGKQVRVDTRELNKGGNKIDFDLSNLAAGTYTATIVTGNEVFSRKIIITK